MAHSMLKVYSLLMYLLSFIGFFFLGIFYAKLIEAGKGQMLAGGAIVLGYGVIGAFIGFLIALIIAYKTNRKTIVYINSFLTVTIILSFTYFTISYKNRKHNNNQETEEIKRPTTTVPNDGSTAMLTSFSEITINNKESNIGLGMFAPKLSNNSLYFYGNINLEKAINEHSPIDSLIFTKNKYGFYDITSAPPWLVPEHLKLDYDLLLFKVLSVTDDFVEVEVNKLNNESSFIDKSRGKLIYWPEFLLNVNSIELINQEQKIHVKPLIHSSIVDSNYSFMQPLKISHKWLYVKLVNNNYEAVGKGWIRWRDSNKLLIKYSLLS